MMVWQWIKRALPTKCSLLQCQIIKDLSLVSCPWCANASETDLHLILFRHHYKKIWKQVDIDLAPDVSPSSIPFQVLNNFFFHQSKHGENGLDKTANIWWLIWKARNASVFDNVLLNPIYLVAAVNGLVSDSSQISGFMAPHSPRASHQPSLIWILLRLMLMLLQIRA